MMIFVAIAAVIIVLILPIKIAAKFVGAKRTGFLSCLLALILAQAYQTALHRSVPILTENLIYWGVASLLGSALVYMLVFDTTYLRGIVISLVHIGLLIVLIVLAGTFLGLVI